MESPFCTSERTKVRSESPASPRRRISFQEGEVLLKKTEESCTVSSALVTKKTCWMVQACFYEKNEQKTEPG